ALSSRHDDAPRGVRFENRYRLPLEERRRQTEHVGLREQRALGVVVDDAVISELLVVADAVEETSFDLRRPKLAGEVDAYAPPARRRKNAFRRRTHGRRSKSARRIVPPWRCR